MTNILAFIRIKGDTDNNAFNGESPLALVLSGAHPRQADGADWRGVGDGCDNGRRLGQDEFALPDEAGGHQATLAIAAVAEGLRSKKCSRKFLP